MTATGTTVAEGVVRRFARAVLTFAVRGRSAQGGPWGEAVLGEFERTSGCVEAVRWAVGGLRAVWLERRGRARELPHWQRVARRWVLITLVAVGSMIAVNQYVLAARHTPSGAMEPTLNSADVWLLDRVSFRFSGLDHGDVISYKAVVADAGEARTYFHTMRVIGLPGDTISCRDGYVYRDGARIDEPYLPTDRSWAYTDCAQALVPADRLYVLGDSRSVSADSRHNGTVAIDDVEGRRLFTIWPVTR
ncbi:MAG TPA: signal peptidase I [Actinoplanes sp.]|nr:signal peptidase I [Actinoplanes sp.]